jgi:hypothetical protein
MAWKRISDQLVVAHLDGKVRQLLVTAWDSYSGAIHVDWPPVPPGATTHSAHTRVRKTTIEKSRYEPLDPEAFRLATSG